MPRHRLACPGCSKRAMTGWPEFPKGGPNSPLYGRVARIPEGSQSCGKTTATWAVCNSMCLHSPALIRSLPWCKSDRLRATILAFIVFVVAMIITVAAAAAIPGHLLAERVPI